MNPISQAERIESLLSKGFRWECNCGKYHKTFATARSCTSCVTYLQTRMMRRSPIINLAELHKKNGG